jgi:hypothetical protein
MDLFGCSNVNDETPEKIEAVRLIIRIRIQEAYDRMLETNSDVEYLHIADDITNDILIFKWVIGDVWNAMKLPDTIGLDYSRINSPQVFLYKYNYFS